jgi:superfamily II DNA/RNA helicase
VPQQSFADLGVSPTLVAALSGRGITTPFPVQRLVIGDVLDGRDVLTKSPTGSGKTLAFGIPIVEALEPRDPRPSALVLVPTRELASQIVAELSDLCHARGLSIAAVYGGTGIESQSRAARRAHILVATPGRLEDLMARGTISLAEVGILVLDEADRMLDMGFRPPVDRIVRAIPARRQTLFFSATLEGEVQRLADRYTVNARRYEQAAGVERRDEVEHRFLDVLHEDKLDTLVHELGRDHGARVLVFVRTKRGADRLVKRLRGQNVTALAMHGDKSQPQREKALRRFEEGDVATLVATDVAARGIDVEGITHVINFDAPADREGYVHRVGRTGRAGRGGVGITFVLPEQRADVAKIAGALALGSEPRSSGNTGHERARPRSGRRRGRS